MQEKIGRIRKSAFLSPEIPIENLKIPQDSFLKLSQEKRHTQSGGRVSDGIRDPGPKKYRDGWRDKPNTHNGHNNNDR